MESRKLCAYNQTRECFLGLEVAATDLACADLKVLFKKLTLRSGEGLWMVPFGNTGYGYAGPAGSYLPGRGLPGQ